LPDGAGLGSVRPRGAGLESALPGGMRSERVPPDGVGLGSVRPRGAGLENALPGRMQSERVPPDGVRLIRTPPARHPPEDRVSIFLIAESDTLNGSLQDRLLVPLIRLRREQCLPALSPPGESLPSKPAVPPFAAHAAALCSPSDAE